MMLVVLLFCLGGKAASDLLFVSGPLRVEAGAAPPGTLCGCRRCSSPNLPTNITPTDIA